MSPFSYSFIDEPQDWYRVVALAWDLWQTVFTEGCGSVAVWSQREDTRPKMIQQ